MAKETRKFAATSNLIRVFILDSTKTDGSGLSTLVYNTSGLVIDVIADNAASGAVYHYKSAATATIQDIGTSGSTCGTYAAPSASNCRFAPVDTTNFPGLYELQFLDGLFDDAGSKRLIGMVHGPTATTPTLFEIELVAYDPQDAVTLGLTGMKSEVVKWNGVTVVDSLYALFGISLKNTMGSAGHSTTAGSLASGDGAHAKVGDYIWVPATYDIHRIATLSTDAWTVATTDAFRTDPNGATYYLIPAAVVQPFVDADFTPASLTSLIAAIQASLATGTNVSDAQAAVLAKLPAALTTDGNIKADALRVGGTAQTGADVGGLVATIGAAGAGLTAITGKTDNLPSDPADESLVIAATDAIAAAIAALENLSSAQAQTAVAAALAASGVNPTDGVSKIAGHTLGDAGTGGQGVGAV